MRKKNEKKKVENYKLSIDSHFLIIFQTKRVCKATSNVYWLPAHRDDFKTSTVSEEAIHMFLSNSPIDHGCIKTIKDYSSFMRYILNFSSFEIKGIRE